MTAHANWLSTPPGEAKNIAKAMLDSLYEVLNCLEQEDATTHVDHETDNVSKKLGKLNQDEKELLDTLHFLSQGADSDDSQVQQIMVLLASIEDERNMVLKKHHAHEISSSSSDKKSAPETFSTLSWSSTDLIPQQDTIEFLPDMIPPAARKPALTYPITGFNIEKRFSF
jgi:hypothetical protein